MRRTLVLALVALFAGLAVYAAPAAASPDWSRTWGHGFAGGGVSHVHGPPEQNAIIVGNPPNGYHVIHVDGAGQPLSEGHLLAFADAMEELQTAFADRLAAGTETHADLARRAAGIVLGNPGMVYSPGHADMTGDVRAAQVWQNVHTAHPGVVGPVQKVILESNPEATETLPVGEQVEKLFENLDHPALTGDPTLDRGWKPPASVDELIELLRNPPLTTVPVPDGTVILPVPVVPIPVPATLAPGPWIPVAPTIPAPGSITAPSAPAGAPAGAPLGGPLLRPLREMATNFFVPVTGFDPSGVTGTGHDDAAGGDEGESCPEDQICPGDPDYPNEGPTETDDDDAGCIGWRECSAVGGGGEPTSIVQTGETGCGIARCTVNGEIGSNVAPPPTSPVQPASP